MVSLFSRRTVYNNYCKYYPGSVYALAVKYVRTVANLHRIQVSGRRLFTRCKVNSTRTRQTSYDEELPCPIFMFYSIDRHVVVVALRCGHREKQWLIAEVLRGMSFTGSKFSIRRLHMATFTS